MAFYESPRFPERISYGATGGPEFITTVVRTISGREQRDSRWAYPRQRWDVSQGVRTQAQFAELRAFFLAMRGRLHGWRFKDWSDFEATHSEGFVTGITSTTFQLIKRYTSGAQTLDRKITKPLAAGFVLKDVSTTLTLTTDYTIDATTGIVTTTTTRTAANLNWSGQFDVPMRFDTDQLQASMIARNPSAGLIHQWDSIPVVEVPL